MDSSESAESWDVYASMFGGIPASEIKALQEYWDAFPDLKNELFQNSESPYLELKTDDIKEAIKNQHDVAAFNNKFTGAFSSFNDYLKHELIDNMETLAVTKEENIISEDIFRRLEDIPLIDKYEAYQLLDNEWDKISIDLEIIQTEGFEAIRKVDPNMVLKKKDGKDQEIQEGWIGHVIPFALVQDTILKDESFELKMKESRLAEIPSEYESIIEEMTEEEKETDVLNDSNDAFVFKEVTKKLKSLKKEEKTSEMVAFMEKLQRADNAQSEEKRLKKEIKKETALIHEKTKETIEQLSDEQIYSLLEIKWIKSLMDNLCGLPDSIIDNFINKIQSLSRKYETTYNELETQINETESQLCSMIDDLEGDEFDMKGLSALKALLQGE